jgi:hypothetical protein
MWERPYGAPSWIGIFFLKRQKGTLEDIEGIGYNVKFKGCQGWQEVHRGC